MSLRRCHLSAAEHSESPVTHFCEALGAVTGQEPGGAFVVNSSSERYNKYIYLDMTSLFFV